MTITREETLVAVLPTERGSAELRDWERIVVERLSVTQWRVCDMRWFDHDARGLRGYIEKKGDIFEAMQLGRGFEWFSFPSLEEATTHFTIPRLTTAFEDENVLSRLRVEAEGSPTTLPAQPAAQAMGYRPLE
jgi:hypothetical protein